MPTATLTFDLDTEREQFNDAMNGWAYRATLQDLDGKLRDLLKYDDPTRLQYEVYAEVRRWLHECTEEYGVEVW